MKEETECQTKDETVIIVTLTLFCFINCLFTELMISDRHQKKEIRQLEQELPRWQVLVDSITGMVTGTSDRPADSLYI